METQAKALKVLIVDDEPMIREGLRTIIDWESYGFRVVGDASGGVEALAKHLQLSPDLMVVDIKMPGMNGLQVIEEVRKVDEKCCFVILSGYSDFAYAKQAIGYGVKGYLLKPINKKELGLLVKQIGEYILDRIIAERKMKQAQTVRRAELLKAVLVNDPNRRMLANHLQELKGFLGGSGKQFQITLFRFNPGETGDSAAAKTLFEEALFEYVEDRNIGWVFPVGTDMGVLLIDRNAQDEFNGNGLRNIQAAFHSGSTFTAASGQIVGDVEALIHSYRTAKDLMNRSFWLAPGKIHGQRAEEQKVREPAPEPDIQALASRIYYALEIGNAGNICSVLKEAADQISHYDQTELAVKSSFAKLAVHVVKLAAVSGRQPAIDPCLSMIANMHKHRHLSGLIEEMEHRFLRLSIEMRGTGSSEPIMKQMTDFIDRNYKDPLRLETLAELFNYHSGYLGRMFKNHTGLSFNAYLDKVRIERAIQLLREGCKVREAAERVGYPNADYFHLKFKKYTGMSPSSYKA
ncbi:response regulator [Cohnella sp. CFH 77786]|uniref:response regulator transcription factor n=1 Tax=Cohnella sp. CFH 77786 TaxID=2662265 RepID=UPI001C60A9A7|nr:response regulator transcription factor [Cohnella sp. CFH 77786]MBW5445165.1 response regulator [Cohnella sp. CFH 77786]